MGYGEAEFGAVGVGYGGDFAMDAGVGQGRDEAAQSVHGAADGGGQAGEVGDDMEYV